MFSFRITPGALLMASVIVRDRTAPELVPLGKGVASVETMPVAELLRSQRRWGRTRAQKFLAPLSVSENRQLGRLLIDGVDLGQCDHTPMNPQQVEDGEVLL